MSIGDGTKIAVRFTQPLIGDVTGLNPPISTGERRIDDSSIVITVSGTYTSSYPASNAHDGSTSTLWSSANNVANPWICYQLSEEQIVDKVRFYLSSSLYINTFTLSGSNNGTDFTDIITEEPVPNAGTAGWKEVTFTNTTKYKYYKMTAVSIASSRIDLYELELYNTAYPLGNETKFNITFNQYDKVPGGSLESKAIQPVEVTRYAFESNSDVDLDEGIYSDITNTDGVLMLSEQEEE